MIGRKMRFKARNARIITSPRISCAAHPMTGVADVFGRSRINVHMTRLAVFPGYRDLSGNAKIPGVRPLPDTCFR